MYFKNKSLIKSAKRFQPWDFGFALDIEKQILSQMLEFFQSNDLTGESSHICSKIRLALHLLKISTGDESIWLGGDKLLGYVNTNNYKRFIKNLDLDIQQPCLKNFIREQKAWYLYNKVRIYYMQTWWE